MEIFESYIPADVPTFLAVSVISVVAIWLFAFIVRKLIGIALVVALIVGGFVVWHNPAILNTIGHTASDQFDRLFY